MLSNFTSVELKDEAFIVIMPIESLKDPIALSVSSIWKTSMASLAYVGFVEPVPDDCRMDLGDGARERANAVDRATAALDHVGTRDRVLGGLDLDGTGAAAAGQQRDDERSQNERSDHVCHPSPPYGKSMPGSMRVSLPKR